MKIAVLGYGTVGSGVVEVLEQNHDLITRRAGKEIEVKYVLDLRDFPGQKIQEKIVHDYDVILRDKEIQMVVEVMGGIEPATTFVRNALMSGKSVVTSNKALVAENGAELLGIARENKVNFLFEASVGGGIPIIRTLGSALTADSIEEITGILNGTTNFMMSKMSQDGTDYTSALEEAQKLGYAEADPTADVEGVDACRKIAILTSIVSEKKVEFDKIYTEGIREITVEDMRYAKALGRSIKLLASCRSTKGRWTAFVAPCLLDHSHPLYGVNGVFNAIYVRGNMLGDAMFYGSGAGKLPTASAVVADVIAEAKHPQTDIMNFWAEEQLELDSHMGIIRTFFVRMKGELERMKDRVQEVFGASEFIVLDKLEGEFGFVTEAMSEELFLEKAKDFPEICHMLRMES